MRVRRKSSSVKKIWENLVKGSDSRALLKNSWKNSPALKDPGTQREQIAKFYKKYI